MIRTWNCICLIVLAVMIAGCRSTYYSAMETFGKHKRDLLVDRVEEARQDQEEAKQQFRTALERFSDVVRLRETDLKAKYDALKSEHDRSKGKAADVSARIKSIEQVSKDLFRNGRRSLTSIPTPIFAGPASNSWSRRRSDMTG